MSEKQMPEFFYEIFHASLPRLGPGNDASTRQALGMALAGMKDKAAADLRILDIGCGSGPQTLVLAQELPGASIIAIDNHRPFLEELERRASAAGLAGGIEIMERDMAAMEFPDSSFDLIWSEGALFAMGFRDGIAACHRLLMPGGCVGATELCWFKPDVPEKCRAFFAHAYPPMTDVVSNLSSLTEIGYEILGHFALPTSAWLDSFYDPLEARLQALPGEYGADPQKREIIDATQSEIDMYRRYGSYYGYEFFVAQRST